MRAAAHGNVFLVCQSKSNKNNAGQSASAAVGKSLICPLEAQNEPYPGRYGVELHFEVAQCLQRVVQSQPAGTGAEAQQ